MAVTSPVPDNIDAFLDTPTPERWLDTARERLALVFDGDTFQEMHLFMKHRCARFGLEGKRLIAIGGRLHRLKGVHEMFRMLAHLRADQSLPTQAIRNIPPDEFRVGMRLRAIFKPAAERKVDDVDNDWMYPTIGDVVERWEPTGEPDVPLDELPEIL